MSLPVQLTVRGRLVPTDLDAARVLHNETAGSAQGIAAARALGDLSHKVYAPCKRTRQNGAESGELLFLDVWLTPEGIGQFFSNPHTQQQAARMFSSKDATVWMRATGAYTFHLPAPRAAGTLYVGMIRGRVASPEKAIELFASVDAKAVRDARRRGQVSHELFVKMPLPGADAAPELLGLDVWSSFDGMSEHYADPAHVPALAGAFAERAATSIWEQAPGDWSEW